MKRFVTLLCCVIGMLCSWPGIAGAPDSLKGPAEKLIDQQIRQPTPQPVPYQQQIWQPPPQSAPYQQQISKENPRLLPQLHVGDYFVYDDYSNTGGLVHTEERVVREEKNENTTVWVVSNTNGIYTRWIDQNSGLMVRGESETNYSVPQNYSINNKSFKAVRNKKIISYDIQNKTMQGRAWTTDVTGHTYEETESSSNPRFEIYKVMHAPGIGDWYPWKTEDYNHQVLEIVTISVPAGTFKCWKIKHIISWRQYYYEYYDFNTGILVRWDNMVNTNGQWGMIEKKELKRFLFSGDASGSANSVSSITPTSGTAGTVATIKGKNFGASQGASYVSFGSAKAVINSWSNTQITAKAPPGQMGSLTVTVNTPSGTSNSVNFTYVDAVTLNIERAHLLERQDFIRLGGLNPQLELEFLDVTKSELINGIGGGNAVPGDECYLGAVDAIAFQQAQRFVGISINKLAADIFSSSISVITTGSFIGDILLKLTAEMINSTALGLPLDETLLVFVTEKAAGYIAGKATESFILGETVSSLTEKSIGELLKKDDPIVWELSGSNKGTTSQRSRLAPLTNIKAELFYSPYTHYTTALIGATCNLQSGTRKALYILQYKVVKSAFESAEIVDGTLRVAVRQHQ
ncbi:MAG: IPT/TIG domain-containing protein [Methylococcaceae bacterium]|jgi:hypothetical protein